MTGFYDVSEMWKNLIDFFEMRHLPFSSPPVFGVK